MKARSIAALVALVVAATSAAAVIVDSCSSSPAPRATFKRRPLPPQQVFTTPVDAGAP